MTSVASSNASPLSGLYSERARGLPSRPRINTDTVTSAIAFTYGFPDPASLPADQVAEATNRALSRAGEHALQYGPTTGVGELIDVLLAKLKRHQGIEAARDNVLITAGASQALGLILDAFIDRGDAIITEEPTWMGAVVGFRNVGAQPIPVPVDDQGTDVVALERALKTLADQGQTAKFIYVIPNFQNPSGISSTIERRQRIAELAAEYGTLVLEDDAYHDLRYAGERLPTIYSMDRQGRTMYMGTFSKVMGAGMRLGWLVASPEIITKLSILKIDGGTNVFGSYVAAEWIPEHLDDHVERLKAIYHQRRDLMVAALERHMPSGTTWTVPEGGFFIWVTLPEGLDAGRLALMARERGVEFLPGEQCFVTDQGQNTLRLSFSFSEDEQIEPGIKVIGEVVQAELLESGRA